MSKITMYDEFTNFMTELIELLKEDWIKFKIFIKKNKNYCLWVLILFITLQFTDLLNLGASWNRYCSKNESKYTNNNNNNIQLGGAEGAPAPTAPTSQIPKMMSKEEKKVKKLEKRAMKEEKKANRKAKAKAYGKGAPGGVGGVPGLSTSIDKIMEMTSGMFVILSFILVVIGIISLPILVFIIITYTIVKYMVSKVSNL